MLNEKKGITLVSLVITIIVLLILATVAISLAVSENGLFENAKNAGNKWNSAVKNEHDVIQDKLNEFNQLYNTYNTL